MLLLLLSLISATPDTLQLSLSMALDQALRNSPAQAQASASRLSSGVAIGQGINALLPAASGSLAYGTTTSQLIPSSDSTVTTKGWDGTLTLSQVIFDPRVFAGVANSFIQAGYYSVDAQDKQAKLIFDVTKTARSKPIRARAPQSLPRRPASSAINTTSSAGHLGVSRVA